MLIIAGDCLRIDEVSQATAAEVATAFGEDDAAAGMALLRLVRQGLASRELDEPMGAYLYALTDKGRARLAYFDGQAE